MAVLAHKQIAPEQIDYIFLTHIHLDHAGGAGEFMQQLPNARLVVHPRGASHMVNPVKLIAGVMAVYGESEFRRIYGEIQPISAERIIEAPDDTLIKLNGRPLRLLDTPGHARHHYCIHDAGSASIFTGDTFGVSYREFDANGLEFVFRPLHQCSLTLKPHMPPSTDSWRCARNRHFLLIMGASATFRTMHHRCTHSSMPLSASYNKPQKLQIGNLSL